MKLLSDIMKKAGMLNGKKDKVNMHVMRTFLRMLQNGQIQS